MNPLPIKENSPEWARWLYAEAKRLQEDEKEVGPNLQQLEELLLTWQQNRPQMWKRLKGRVLARPLAIVLQDRYHKEREKLQKAGMAPPDAREQAMADWLLMTPEEPDQPEPN